MNIAFAARIICDISLWYCGAGLILPHFGATINAIIPATMLLCCIISSALSRRKTAYRLIPLPILAVAFFFIHTAGDVLLNLPPLLYCAGLCYRSRFNPDYESSCGYYKTAAISLLSATFLFLAFGGSSLVSGVLKYLLVFLFSGVLMLRLLRHNEQNRREWRLQVIDLTLLLLCCTAALFLSSGAFLGIAGRIALFLYKSIIVPLLLGLAYAISFIFWLLSRLISTKSPEGNVLKFNSDNMKLSEIFGPDIANEYAKSKLPGQILLALGIIIFAVLAFLVFRRLSRGIGKTTGNFAEHGSRMQSIVDSSPLMALAPRTPREAVRYYYRKFLLILKSSGQSISPSDTSESISRAAGAYYDPALVSELRDIYIKARYSPESVTKSDSRRVKELYGRIKSEHKKSL